MYLSVAGLQIACLIFKVLPSLNAQNQSSYSKEVLRKKLLGSARAQNLCSAITSSASLLRTLYLTRLQAPEPSEENSETDHEHAARQEMHRTLSGRYKNPSIDNMVPFGVESRPNQPLASLDRFASDDHFLVNSTIAECAADQLSGLSYMADGSNRVCHALSCCTY